LALLAITELSRNCHAGIKGERNWQNHRRKVELHCGNGPHPRRPRHIVSSYSFNSSELGVIVCQTCGYAFFIICIIFKVFRGFPRFHYKFTTQKWFGFLRSGHFVDSMVCWKIKEEILEAIQESEI
jgi:hypothetical protein